MHLPFSDKSCQFNSDCFTPTSSCNPSDTNVFDTVGAGDMVGAGDYDSVINNDTDDNDVNFVHQPNPYFDEEDSLITYSGGGYQ